MAPKKSSGYDKDKKVEKPPNDDDKRRQEQGEDQQGDESPAPDPQAAGSNQMFNPFNLDNDMDAVITGAVGNLTVFPRREGFDGEACQGLPNPKGNRSQD